MFYRFVRSVVSFALRLFYRVAVKGPSPPADGPVIFVGNHPNALIDPALVFVITDRHVTFLAKEPLFRTPLISTILRGLDALPVYRKQDDPTQMARNEGTLGAAADALVAGRAITLFPEGRSHSEPELGEIKTGASRIAFRAQAQGAAVRIIPVGLTYADKHRFRSDVLIEIGEAIEVAPLLPKRDDEAAEAAAVRALTDRIETALRAVTLNLEAWEDLGVIETAEALYSLHLGEQPRDPERMRRFARGLELFRSEQPQRFQRLRDEVVSFRRRLDLIRVRPSELTIDYRPGLVLAFALRNLAALLLGFPLFAAGVLLFAVPFQIPRVLNRVLDVSLDQQATLKFVATLLLTPIWWALITWLAWSRLGLGWGLGTLLGALPLAIYTRYFYERRRTALHDIRTFFVLAGRKRLKQLLLAEGDALAAQVDAIAAELRPRVVDAGRA